MFDIEIFRKTAKGREEMVSRSHGLAPRLRAALILIDGKTQWNALSQILAPLGTPDALIQVLRDEGMVESNFDLPPMPVFPARTEPTAIQPQK